MKRRSFFERCGMGLAGTFLMGANAAPKSAAPAPVKKRRVFSTPRSDGRFKDTAGFLQSYIKNNPPKLAFDPEMKAQDFPAWREQIREKMIELLAFPQVSEQPAPKKISSEAREGYRLERWEAYPEDYSVVPFLVLVPDGASMQAPAPAVMCFPGSTWSKESLAGEPELPGVKTRQEDWKWKDNRMALHFVRQGMVAVAVDNPATCEVNSTLRGRGEVSSLALWAGRNYLGISVFQKAAILEWLSQESYVDPKRMAACGHSLGSDPADALGLIYPELISAVIHNDFCCDWRERTIAQNADPGGIHHLVPGAYAWYDAPDIQAALAPCPLLFTEGGRTPHLNRIRAAYKLMNAEDKLKISYYKKYLTPDLRPYDTAPLPEGLSVDEYFEYANVDPSFHCFRPTRAIPWLREVFGLPKAGEGK